jgi:two-component system nitrogen regulation response regulator NtrX
MPENMEVELSASRSATHPAAWSVPKEAHGGTLFIDEIADMPRETQNKILAVLVD